MTQLFDIHINGIRIGDGHSKADAMKIVANKLTQISKFRYVSYNPQCIIEFKAY